MTAITRTFSGLLAISLLGTLPQNCDGLMGQNLQVSTEQLENHLRTAFSQPRSYNHTSETDFVRGYIHEFFTNLTTQCPTARVEEQRVNCEHLATATGGKVSGICHNIFLVQRGTSWGTSRDHIILVGAHYDTQLNTPGVDDNGSGMAALLETARVAVGCKCNSNYTIIYIAFDVEEYGLNGSQLFVDQYLVPQVLNQYDATFDGAIVLDTVMNFNAEYNSQVAPPGAEQVFPEQYILWQEHGFRGDFLVMIGRQDDRDLLHNMSTALSSLDPDGFAGGAIQLPVSGKPDSTGLWPHLRDFMRSDHTRFWLANNTLNGLKAIFLTDTANYRKPMDDCYHNPCDDLSMLTQENLAFLTQTTQAIVQVVTRQHGYPCSPSEMLPTTANPVTEPGQVQDSATAPSATVLLVTLSFLLNQSW